MTKYDQAEKRRRIRDGYKQEYQDLQHWQSVLFFVDLNSKVCVVRVPLVNRVGDRPEAFVCAGIPYYPTTTFVNALSWYSRVFLL